jgi:protein tyrosine phosphatase (PTP) superfamily phosphohydrolase (DUF442 family)
MLALTLAAAATPAWVLLRPVWSSNLGIVDPGRVIRAAQPTSQLAALIKEHHLASILNLRGGSPRDWWYTAEVRTAEKSGVAFFDVPLSATRRPSRHDLLVLIDLFEHCTYPLLIHCKAGADRTGLASAIYLMMQRGEAPRQAARSFSFYYSHLPIFGTERLHAPLDEYAAWLQANSLEHTPRLFREWVRNDYRSDDPPVDPAPVAPGPRRPLPQGSLDPSSQPGCDVSMGQLPTRFGRRADRRSFGPSGESLEVDQGRVRSVRLFSEHQRPRVTDYG